MYFVNFMCPPSSEITSWVAPEMKFKGFYPKFTCWISWCERNSFWLTLRECGFHKAVTRKLCRRSKTRISRISFNGQRTKRVTESHRLDTFYWKWCDGISTFKKLVEVSKVILTLSHGQASVERSFSVNKSLLVENLATKSLIAQRIIYGYMKVNNRSAEDMDICPTHRLNVKYAMDGEMFPKKKIWKLENQNLIRFGKLRRRKMKN